MRPSNCLKSQPNSIYIMQNNLIAADRLLRAGRIAEALSCYDALAKQSKDSKTRDRAVSACKLCRSLLHKKGPNQAQELTQDSSTHHTLSIRPKSEEMIQGFSCKIPESVTQGEALPEIVRNGILDLKICLKAFYQSPWQTSLGFTAALIASEYGAHEAIVDDALSSFQEEKMSYSCIVAAYLDPQCCIFLEQALKRDSRRRLLLKNLFLVYTQLKSESRLQHVGSVCLALRKLNKYWPRYILDQDLRSLEPLASGKRDVRAGSIFLNEEKFIWKNLSNHYDFVNSWYIVEGACKGYPPQRVTKEGQSIDLSFLKLSLFPDPLKKIRYFEHGWTKASGEEAKSELRNNYLRGLHHEVLAVIDIDEFYSKTAFDHAIRKIEEGYSGVVIPQMHLWKNIKEFITGGYYDISHMRFFKGDKALRYVSNHNFPETTGGKRLDMISKFKFERSLKTLSNGDIEWQQPFCVHCGFIKDHEDMKDKTEYYVNRGEEKSRPITSQSRAAWFDENLPSDCKVRPHANRLIGVYES